MTSLRDALATAPDVWLTIGGFAIGALFGWLVSATNYCATGAITDWRLNGDTTRLGAAALAAAVAIFGAQGLDAAGVANLSASIYLAPRLNAIGAIAGGLIFGWGMVFAGGCPSRLLVRAGSGDLRALLSLLAMSVAALAVLSGVLGRARVAIDSAAALDLSALGLDTQSTTSALRAAGMEGPFARCLAIALVAGPLLALAFGRARLSRSPRNLIAGFGVGLLVTAGWALTGLASDEMALSPTPTASLSFVKPVSDCIDWIERSTALGLPGFGAASVFGVLCGGFVAALASRTFRYAGFADRDDLGRHMFGALCLGTGGVLAMGCSIGQGVTGLSSLALQSIPTVASIVLGAVLALERLHKTI